MKKQDGLDYRGIADLMTSEGDRMNHSTARNVFLRGMRQITQRLVEGSGGCMTESGLDRLARNGSWQTSIAEILREE